MVQNAPPNVNFLLLFDQLYEVPKVEIDPSQSITLSEISHRDNVWDIHRTNTMHIGEMYAQAQEFEKYARRMEMCSGWLRFGATESGLQLKSASFCHVRHCPVCQWRKSLYWRAMIYQTLPCVTEKYPKHRWLFMTLTVKNCDIGELRVTLNDMNKAWQRLIKRKEFSLVDGWIRTTEITRNKRTNQAHPHFHIVLMVKSDYFRGRGYVKQADWVRIWGECLQIDYLPVVDVRTVKQRHRNAQNVAYTALQSAVVETLKYSVKPSDMLSGGVLDTVSVDWLHELTRQTHKLRFVAVGGVLKNALKTIEQITDTEMIAAGENKQQEQNIDSRRLNFTYYPTYRKYVYNPRYNE